MNAKKWLALLLGVLLILSAFTGCSGGAPAETGENEAAEEPAETSGEVSEDAPEIDYEAVAQQDMPNSLTCAMDSVAVRWSDFEDGMPDTSTWERGVQWQFANTGVGMPEGFDTAIVVEHVLFSDDDARVSFDALPSKQFAGTIPAGSRMHAGDVLVSAGTMVTPLLAAHIASGNNVAVEVLRRIKVE